VSGCELSCTRQGLSAFREILTMYVTIEFQGLHGGGNSPMGYIQDLHTQTSSVLET
jgi:hypothetical protein